jgi:acyl transferase domain-containing protein
MGDSKTVFMFSGQGGQYYQMGRPLFEQVPAFRRQLRALDAMAQDLGSVSIVAALYDDTRGKAEPFDRTRLTHPAIFMVECALARTLIEHDVHPDLTLGVSMGAFAAAAVAGHLGTEAALALVLRQARAIEAHSEAGGMIAVLADPALHLRAELREASVIAAHNFSGHFVLAARQRDLASIEDFLRAQGVTHQRLPIRAPFHSPWIDAAEAPFLQGAPAAAGRAGTPLPCVCAARADLLDAPSPGYFWRTIRAPIAFQRTVAWLEREGPYRYIDAGPAGTLATFLKYGLARSSSSQALPILSPYGGDVAKLTALTASRCAVPG